jgi:ribosomal protein S18 acetylase RimI-like enzyme
MLWVIYGIMTLAIRTADPDDAVLASRLMHLSMGELADYLFGGVRLSVDEILAGLFSLDGNRFSRSIADLAEWGGQPAGMLVSFPGREFTRRELAIGLGLLKLCGLWDVLRLSVRALSIANGVETYRDEYYLANMAVSPEFQGRGIGSNLMTHAEDKAWRAGLKKCSLIVDLENPAARRLYERCGYQVVFTKTYPGPAENAHAGYHRMLKELN